MQKELWLNFVGGEISGDMYERSVTHLGRKSEKGRKVEERKDFYEEM